MPQDMAGFPVPVSLISDPVAKKIAAAAQTGKLTPDNGPDLNTVDLFRNTSGVMVTGGMMQSGTAVIILNSLSTPLTLVDNYVNLADSGQRCYPALIDPNTGDASSKHQIPGTRPYPRPSKHPKGALMGGIGIYRFQGGLLGHVNRALSFTFAKDGSTVDPILGVAFSCLPSPNTALLGGSKGDVAVTADLGKLGGSAGTDKLGTLYGGTGSGPHSATVKTADTTVTIYAAFVSAKSQIENTLTITVWVRDLASTLGV